MVNTLTQILKSVPTDFSPGIELFSVKRDNILNGLGMKHSDADEYLLNLIDSIKNKYIKLAQPRASLSFIYHPIVNLQSRQIILNNIVFETGKIVSSMLRKSEVVVVFACTIGNGIEEASKDQMRLGNSLEGFIIDLVGSELAEGVADYLHNLLKEKLINSNYGLSNRYSPGYCNWSVTGQHDLFSLMGENNCDIQLTPTSLMLPIKSVSGILGIGKHMQHIDYKCQLCTDKKCILRNR